MALPEKEIKTNAVTTFIGLQSYTKEQAGSFFGRDTEIEKLSTLIHSNTLTLVFGKSGTGKTSLLNAGVFPQLHKNYCLPFRIRLNFNDNSADLITQIKHVLRTEIEEYKFKVKSYPGEETLWEYFHKEPLWKSITPVLIFDQFEEIFTLAEKNKNFTSDELAHFWQVLSNLAENSIPESLREQFRNLDNEVGYNYKKQKVKIVFAFREEYLPEFESISKIIPSIKTSRFRLMPMNGHQALEVITKTWKEEIRLSEARKIVSYLQDNEQEDYDLMAIEPSLLSQVCAYIDKERLDDGYKTVSEDFLKTHSKENILREIYDDALKAAAVNVAVIETDEKIQPYNPVKKFLEDKMITSEGYRIRYSPGVDDESIRPGIIALKDRYFIREDDKSIELTHDVLTPIIKKDRESRRKSIAQAAERKRARRKAALIILAAVLLGLGTYAAVTWKARTEKNKLEAQVKEIKKAFDENALKLDSLQNLIAVKERDLNSIPDRKKGATGGALVTDSLGDAERQGLLNELSELQNIYEKLRNENQARKQSYNALVNTPRKMMTAKPSTNLLMEMEDMKDANERLKALLRQSAKSYDSLLNLYMVTNKLLNKLATVTSEVSPASIPVDTSNALQLNLFFSKAQFGKNSPGENTPVFLIPYNSKNRKIIRTAKLFEISCDEAALRMADGFKASRYHNGKFVFENVAPGKYLVKICGYYGGYYTVNKSTNGSITERLDASPPIR